MEGCPMRNDAQSPDPRTAPLAPAPANGCGARFELALVAAFKGGPPPSRPRG